ncbi:MAG: hypothetical protein A3C11_00135 [Candidatus Sungbacteria bacterium RIFCSPHIGHO2_02_FULL_49_12]|uniref:Uncharacterized protein n=1 Tax=Candidatus Sungbacteria bacterium RIFCSPHIGHO2_02_FULL_49_12 TaxID=1802271 RepID=A0A1G2KT16_9BACT|nr:MAG: hypothetical protein A3C11_00135 [Candidatus Sungbacteria bacterium RIFCSPHIGHO2_02_FULL_49_12]
MMERLPAGTSQDDSLAGLTADEFLAEMRRRRAAAHQEIVTVPDVAPAEVTPARATYRRTYGLSPTGPGGIIGLLIKSGVVTNKNAANIMLIGVAAVAVALTVWILWRAGSTTAPASAPPLGVPMPQRVPTP